MHPRYFVTSKRLTGTSVAQTTFAFGRFGSLDRAEDVAKEQYGRYGSEVVSVRMETSVEAIGYRIGRFLMRCLRISSGGAIALLTYVFLWTPADKGIVHVPFGSLTLDALFEALMRGGLLMGLGWLAWIIAFGEGPDA